MKPLDGLTVIDMTRLLPGPVATMHLADFGANVIKVEDTGDGDYMRSFSPTVDDNDGTAVNPAFATANRGKRSIALDLKQPQGREILLAMVAKADALIESFRPGVLDRLGCDWPTLQQINPRLVVCSLSGYGETGVMAQRAGHDLNYVALTGVLDQIRANGDPAIPNLQIGDLLGGSLSALATLLIALLSAHRSGQGRRIDVSMTDALLAHHFFPHADVDAGVDPVAGSTLLTGGAACYRVYRAADGCELAVGALEHKFWKAFCAAIGAPELSERHWSYGEAPGSEAARDTAEVVGARIAERSGAEWLAQFEGIDACVTPVLSPAQALQHPHHRQRGIVRTRGAVTHVGPLAQLSGHRWQPRSAPAHGQHTRELLAELGYSSAAIDALIAAGIAAEGAR